MAKTAKKKSPRGMRYAGLDQRNFEDLTTKLVECERKLKVAEEERALFERQRNSSEKHAKDLKTSNEKLKDVLGTLEREYYRLKGFVEHAQQSTERRVLHQKRRKKDAAEAEANVGYFDYTGGTSSLDEWWNK